MPSLVVVPQGPVVTDNGNLILDWQFPQQVCTSLCCLCDGVIHMCVCARIQGPDQSSQIPIKR